MPHPSQSSSSSLIEPPDSGFFQRGRLTLCFKTHCAILMFLKSFLLLFVFDQKSVVLKLPGAGKSLE